MTQAYLPPQNPEAEQYVLGSILIDSAAYSKLEDVLTADDFYLQSNAKIFSAIAELAARGAPVDVLALSAKLREHGTYEEVGGAAHLAELLERVPSSANAEYHARLVAEEAAKRRLFSAAAEIGTRVMAKGERMEELMDFAERTIFRCTAHKSAASIAHSREVVREAVKALEYRFENQGQMTGVPSGYHDLDAITLGFQPADLVIVACRPSMGKTSFALGVARHAALKAKKGVLFFSLEMSRQQLMTRLLAAEARVDSHRIQSGKLSEQDWQNLVRAAGALADAPIYIDDTPALTSMEIRAKARRLKTQLHGKLDVVVVDYLQIMGTPRGIESREQAISGISRSLKALGKELGVPVLALSQLNRSIETRVDKRPMMSDLRESGAIEQDADLIVFIHREHSDAPPAQAAPAEFIIGKNRNGPRDSVKVAWLGQYTSFENLSGAQGDA